MAVMELSVAKLDFPMTDTQTLQPTQQSREQESQECPHQTLTNEAATAGPDAGGPLAERTAGRSACVSAGKRPRRMAGVSPREESGPGSRCQG
jgi:hypothetical protein